jgi:uncharacterized protein YecT (DUF1311 family)
MVYSKILLYAKDMKNILFFNVLALLLSVPLLGEAQGKIDLEKADGKTQFVHGKSLYEAHRDSDRPEAKKWIQKAADQGYAEAIFWLGYAGLGSEKPIYYYEKAADAGYGKALDQVLDHYLFRAGANADINKAKHYGDIARKLNKENKYKADLAQLEIIDRCFEAGNPDLPKEDLPSAEEKAKYKQPDPGCLQYHFDAGESFDWEKYRKCLLAEDAPENNFIAEIYANGWGVKRNAKLALALVCHGSDVPAELASMVSSLSKTKDDEKLERSFLFCDHVTSGLNGGRCAVLAETLAGIKRDRVESALMKNWTSTQKELFKKFEISADEFFNEHSHSEQDLSGTIRGHLVSSEREKLKSELFESIKKIDQGEFPTDASFRSADSELNEVYSKLMKQEYAPEDSTISKDGIKATQRKWLKYRDAWVKFSANRYPKVSADIWKAWLTRQRVDQLNDLLRD